MDPISLAASLVAFVQIADRIIVACKHCIDTIRDAPRDMMIIVGEITSLKTILDSFATDELRAKTANLAPLLFGPSGPVEACRRCLSSLEKLLPSVQHDPQRGSTRLRITLVELAWPLKESRAKKLLAEIAQHKATLLLAMTGSLVQVSFLKALQTV